VVGTGLVYRVPEKETEDRRQETGDRMKTHSKIQNEPKGKEPKARMKDTLENTKRTQGERRQETE
jgi:hypothetical protein